MDEGLEIYLDDSEMCAGDLGRGPMRMRNRSGEWFRLESLRRMIAKTILKASSNQTNDQPIKTYRPRSSDSSESGQIATKSATHLKAVGLQPTNQTIRQTQAQVLARPLRSGLVRGLDQGLEVWNRPGADLRGPEDLGGSGDWCRKRKSRATPDSIC